MWTPKGYGNRQGWTRSNSIVVAPYVGPGDVQSFFMWGSVSRAYSAAKATPSQAAFRIVDGSGGNALDINLTTSGAVNIAILTSWIAIFGTPHVTTLYDQVGSNHWTQATVSKMPTITMNAINGLPALTFASASAQILNSPSISGISIPHTWEAVAKRTANFSSWQEVIASTGHESDIVFYSSPNTVGGFNGTGMQSAASDNTFHVLQNSYNTTSQSINVDAGLFSQPSSGASIADGVVCIGGYLTTLYLDGMVTEAGLYAGTLNSALQSNAMSAYGMSTSSGSGTMDFSIPGGDNTGLITLFEDI